MDDKLCFGVTGFSTVTAVVGDTSICCCTDGFWYNSDIIWIVWINWEVGNRFRWFRLAVSENVFGKFFQTGQNLFTDDTLLTVVCIRSVSIRLVCLEEFGS